MTADLEALLTAPYVKIDDELAGPRWTGRPPVLTDSELVCVAVAQAMLGLTSEAHWLRYARKHLTGLFPYLPQQPGYNKRLRAGPRPDQAGHSGAGTNGTPPSTVNACAWPSKNAS